MIISEMNAPKYAKEKLLAGPLSALLHIVPSAGLLVVPPAIIKPVCRLYLAEKTGQEPTAHSDGK